MKGLKIAVFGLVVLVGVLLFAVRRLNQQVTEGHTQESVSTPLAQTAPAAPEPPLAAPPPAAAPVEQPAKPSPVRNTKRPVTQPRAVQAPAAPVVAESRRVEPPAPAAEPARPEPAPVAAPAPPPAPPAPRRVSIPSGSRLVVTTQNTLSTERNFAGDTFTASLSEPLVVDGFVIAEKGAEVEGRIVRSEKAGRMEGVSSLGVELVRLHTSDGQKLSIATNLHEVRGERSRGSDAKKVGVGAGLGAIIGAIAGGGKGAAIGAGVGAGAGGGAVLATRGEHAVINSESRLSFQIRTPVEVTERR